MLDKILNYDPIDDAEKIIGERNDVSAGLGLLLSMTKNKLVRELMEESGDTHYNIEFEKAIKILEELRFIEEYSEFFHNNNQKEETIKIFVHEELTAVAVIESYDGKRINTFNVHVNITVPNTDYSHPLMKQFIHDTAGHSRGALSYYDRQNQKDTLYETIWLMVDGREALKYHLAKLKPHLTTKPFSLDNLRRVYCVTYMEWKTLGERLGTDDAYNITSERLKKCKSFDRICQ